MPEQGTINTVETETEERKAEAQRSAASEKKRKKGGRPAAESKRFHPLLELTLARVREFLREPEVIFWVFVFPILLVFALGIAFRNQGPQKVHIAVERSESNPAASSAIFDALSQSHDLSVVQLSSAESAQALRSGKVALVVRPNDGGSATTAGATAPSFNYRFDPTRPESRQARMLVD